jgi:nitrite reductase/ring-hydroxylating ferredoxin subunit
MPAVALDELAEGEPRGVTVDGVDVVLVRRGGVVHALAATCTHAGGPLDEGSVDGGCISCPWHGSTFTLVDASIVRGPATTPQPVYETRLVDGQIEVRAPR